MYENDHNDYRHHHNDKRHGNFQSIADTMKIPGKKAIAVVENWPEILPWQSLEGLLSK